ncbi:MAG: universal stress protein [Desulfobacterales bacterium]|jgi:nucleotide-binding universal stress UspA family protein
MPFSTKGVPHDPHQPKDPLCHGPFPNAAFVLRYAAASARRHGATIAVLHVVEPLPATARALVASYLDERERKDLEDRKREKLLDILRRRLERLCEAERDSDPELPGRIESVEAVEGYPADVILVLITR